MDFWLAPVDPWFSSRAGDNDAVWTHFPALPALAEHPSSSAPPWVPLPLHSGSSRGTQAVLCASPAQGAMADGCFLCSCLILRASIARRYKSGNKGRIRHCPGTSSMLHLATCTKQGLQGCPRLQHSAVMWSCAHVVSLHPSSQHLPPQQAHLALKQPLSRVPTPSTPWPSVLAQLPAGQTSDALSKICPEKYQPKVLETSSRCCSREGSHDLILFLIFFFFFFFIPCAEWRNTKFQTPHT